MNEIEGVTTAAQSILGAWPCVLSGGVLLSLFFFSADRAVNGQQQLLRDKYGHLPLEEQQLAIIGDLYAAKCGGPVARAMLW